MAWAEPLGERTWAVESACGSGYFLSQELVSVGEEVVAAEAVQEHEFPLRLPA
jgi:hypothetical protein